MTDASPLRTKQPHRQRRARASVAMGFVTGMLAGLHRRGCEARPLLDAVGIDLADAASRIPVERYAMLYNLVVAELEDEGFGLFPHRMAPGTFEFLCRGMLGAATLGVALNRAGRFMRIVLPTLRIDIQREGQRARLDIVELTPIAAERNDPARVFALEWLLRLLHGVACWFVGRGLALDAVSFPYARPQHADDYALVYTEHSSFDADVLSARFQANLLDLPIRRDEAALASFLQGAPGKISMLYRRDREMVFRVRDLVRDALPDNLSLETVASHLHLSPRTLARRLEEEGSSFRGIKDATRRDIAFARLTKTRQPIAQLAADLGYSDPSAFYRAFVSWSGVSPERYRNRLARDGVPISN
ncbi:AraC family transcriptional regulator [Azoarcus sp. L1K30]|uniref:AraC family transcriptional regulator n=1 Tax=Azoarcus sp. L1K30 TaxID=2820277 RepID=UPI001B84303A|nr:AraC family transcriptional regulator [Azoarcus sp. L1K30]MBR0567906.1 AraC family transcriptional regulator [Azoarcus sp. L1K30]